MSPVEGPIGDGGGLGQLPAAAVETQPILPLTRMMFTARDVDELLNQPCGDPADYNAVQQFVYDKTLCEKVWLRADYLRKLEANLMHVTLDCHKVDEITSYIKECKAQTNYDLNHEAEVANEKLCLMQDALRIGQIINN